MQSGAKVKQAAFMPARIIRGPHVQSIVASANPLRLLVHRRARDYLQEAEDLLIDCGEGTRLLAQFNPARGPSNGRIAVLIHGWEGSGTSIYNLSIGPQLQALGFDTLRLNLRDHGDSHYLNRDLFHSCRLPEVVGAFRWINARFPARRIAIIGFSLGGNFALRVAADANAAGLRIDRVLAVCPVLDPAQTMAALDSGFVLYEKYFINKWRRSLEKKRLAFPDIYDFSDLARFERLRDMTDFFVTRYTEYDDLDTYLRGYAITGDRLKTLETRSTMLLANDDPVIPVHGLDDMVIPDALDVYRAAAGGHCGFIQDLRMRSWLDAFLLEQLAD